MSYLHGTVWMVGLTAVAWIVMYVRRLTTIYKMGLDPESMKNPDIKATLPDKARFAAEHFTNLLEFPILFYLLCVVGLICSVEDTIIYWGIYIYCGMRSLHSLVVLTKNIIKVRFTLYFLSSLLLFFIWARMAFLTIK